MHESLIRILCATGGVIVGAALALAFVVPAEGLDITTRAGEPVVVEVPHGAGGLVVLAGIPVGNGGRGGNGLLVNAPALTDTRIARVAALLAGHALEPYTAEMVAVADAFGIDWRLMPALAFLESTGGDFAHAFNAWGLTDGHGGYRTFASFSEAMRAVAETLAGKRYTDLPPAAKACMWVSGNADCPTPASQRYRANFSEIEGGLTR